MNIDFYQKPFPILKINEEYSLREQSLDDTSAFYKYYSEPVVSQYILASSPKSLTDAMNELHYCRNLFYQKNGLYWSIARQSDDRMIGAVGLYINTHHNRAEICYDLHKDYWRQGIMKAALSTAMEHAFNEMKLARIEAITVKENIGSMAVLEKLGYQHEGSLKNYRQYEGKSHDIELFAITPERLKEYRLEEREMEEAVLV